MNADAFLFGHFLVRMPYHDYFIIIMRSISTRRERERERERENERRKSKKEIKKNKWTEKRKVIK